MRASKHIRRNGVGVWKMSDEEEPWGQTGSPAMVVSPRATHCRFQAFPQRQVDIHVRGKSFSSTLRCG